MKIQMSKQSLQFAKMTIFFQKTIYTHKRKTNKQTQINQPNHTQQKKQINKTTKKPNHHTKEHLVSETVSLYLTDDLKLNMQMMKSC